MRELITLAHLGLAATALSSLPARAQMEVRGGATPPDRVTTTQSIACEGAHGGIALAERFTRTRVPSGIVALVGVTPLGARQQHAASREAAAVFEKMASIERLNWLCDGKRALLVVHYVDAAALADVVNERRPTPADGQLPPERVVMILDHSGFRPERDR